MILLVLLVVVAATASPGPAPRACGRWSTITGKSHAGTAPAAHARGPPPPSAGPETAWPTIHLSPSSSHNGGFTQQHMSISVGRAAPGPECLTSAVEPSYQPHRRNVTTRRHREFR